MEAHICVLQTALALLAQGFQVFVVEDAICSRTQQNQDNALQRLRQAGVIITNTESVLFEWLSDAKHPEFRTLSKLIV
jgi:nicotinamidase-related amidase